MMLSFPEDLVAATDEAALKALDISSRWVMLYAGDPNYVYSILDRSRMLRDRAPEANRDLLSEMERVVKTAYQDELRKQINDRFLSRYGIDMDEFRRKGRGQLGDLFGKLNDQILPFSLKTSLLVCGVEPNGSPHLFSVNNPGGPVVLHDPLGHWAIGTGATMALASLAGRSLHMTSLPDLIYRLCEAKFAAETARGVGASTLITIIRQQAKECRLAYIGWPYTNKLKEIWKIERKKPAPPEAFDALDEPLKYYDLFKD